MAEAEGMNDQERFFSPEKPDETRECTPPRISKKLRVRRKPTHTASCPMNPSRRLVFSSQEEKSPIRKKAKDMKKKKRKMRQRHSGRAKKQKFETRDLDVSGTWVQCTKSGCLKWRYLEDIADPSEIPDVWMCEMNSDTSYNSCELPEQDYTTLEFVHTKFTEGSLVWAKMQGFPWWPAMIEEDPDSELCLYPDPVTGDAIDYHVIFLDKKVTRCWLKASNVRKYEQGADCPGPLTLKGHDYSHKMQAARENADRALAMAIEERIKSFGFSATFRGQWGEEILNASDDDSQPTYERKLKKKMKQKRQLSVSSQDGGDGSLLSNSDMEDILDEAEALLEECQDIVMEVEKDVEKDLLQELEAEELSQKNSAGTSDDSGEKEKNKKRGKPKKSLTETEKEKLEQEKEELKRLRKLEKELNKEKKKQEAKAQKEKEKLEKKEKKQQEEMDRKEKMKEEKEREMKNNKKEEKRKEKMAKKEKKREEKERKKQEKKEKETSDEQVGEDKDKEEKSPEDEAEKLARKEKKRQEKAEKKQLKKEQKEKKKQEEQGKTDCAGNKKQSKKAPKGKETEKVKPCFQKPKKTTFAAPVQKTAPTPPPTPTQDSSAETPAEVSSVRKDIGALLEEIASDKETTESCPLISEATKEASTAPPDTSQVKSSNGPEAEKTIEKSTKKPVKPKFSIKTKDGLSLAESSIPVQKPAPTTSSTSPIPIAEGEVDHCGSEEGCLGDFDDETSVDIGKILEANQEQGHPESSGNGKVTKEDNHGSDPSAFPLSQMIGKQLELLPKTTCPGDNGKESSIPKGDSAPPSPTTQIGDSHESLKEDSIKELGNPEKLAAKFGERDIEEFTPEATDWSEPDGCQLVPGQKMMVTAGGNESDGEDSDPFEMEE